VEGLKPDKEKHQSYFLIQPVSSIMILLPFCKLMSCKAITILTEMQILLDQNYVIVSFWREENKTAIQYIKSKKSSLA
jgi:hypothetical protein